MGSCCAVSESCQGSGGPCPPSLPPRGLAGGTGATGGLSPTLLTPGLATFSSANFPGAQPGSGTTAAPAALAEALGRGHAWAPTRDPQPAAELAPGLDHWLLCPLRRCGRRCRPGGAQHPDPLGPSPLAPCLVVLRRRLRRPWEGQAGPPVPSRPLHPAPPRAPDGGSQGPPSHLLSPFG